MKTILRKATSLLLSTLLAVSLLAVPAGASNALGEDLTQEDTLISQSTVLSTNVFWSTSYSNLRRENLITYTPNSLVTPIVTYGSALTSRSTVGSIAKELEAQGYRVVAGMNGDFYDVGTGLPIGLVVADGEVKSSDPGYYAIGFRADGTAVLGKPGVTVSADMGYQEYDANGYASQAVRRIAGINKARVSTGGIYLYTYEFNTKHTTGNTESGVDVVCSVLDGSLSIGGTMTLQVEQVLQADGATAIQPGQIVLSVNNQSSSYYVDALANETAGSIITLTLTAATEEWNDVVYAVGALYSLLENGAVTPGLDTSMNPRTAIGQKADGTLLFYTIDGRQSGLSIGASLPQVAERLRELGCVTALCLDGGGSTTLSVTKPDATAASTVNSPSDGSQRAVSNQVFLVAGNEPSGKLDHFYISPDSRYVLAGSRVNLNVSAVDTNYIPMAAQGYSLESDRGRLDGDVLTTPSDGGEITVTASSGRRSGSTTVYAIATPDSISLKNGSAAVSSVTMTPGSSLTLTASAMYNHQALKADADAFTWTLTGGIGTVDQNGVITAATPGTGTLTVSAGGKTASVSVTVSQIALRTVEDFENGVSSLASYGSGGSLTSNTASAYVQFGRASGRLDYTLGADGTATAVFKTPLSIPSAYTQLNLWVYGDNSGNALSLLTTDGSLTSVTAIGLLNFSGYKQLTVPLPAGTSGVAGFQITGSPEYDLDEFGDQTVTYPNASGTLYLDQLVASYNGTVDHQAPAVTASLDEASWTVTASVSDAVDGVLPKSAVTVAYNGTAVDFSYNASTGSLTWALPGPGETHEAMRITVTARDASGNIGRASVDVEPSGVGHKFTDINGYWAANYVDFLYNAGITTGYADGTFRPNQNISRAQFAVMLYRYLGLEESKYADVVLPFADSGSIAAYALPAVKALYTEGVINGSAGSDGRLYFNPDAPLSRAQAAAMIGRTQEKGFAAASLTFSDAGSIPSYAAYYVQTLAAQGVLNGYEDGTFRPNANITRGQMAKILYNLL